MPDLSRCRWARITASLLAAALFAGMPGLGAGIGGEARADDEVTVAVVGLFGYPDASDAELDALEAALLGALDDLEGYRGIGYEDYGADVWSRRNAILQSVFLGSAESALQEGRVLYDNAQFQSALISLEKAEDALDRGIEFLRDPRLLVEIHLYEGLANMALGDDSAAERHFEEVARTDPARTLDPVRTPPKMLAAFEQAKLGVAESGQATLEVTSGSVPEAEVFVNGLRVGKTPTTLDLAPGRYHVSVHHPNVGWDYVDETLQQGDDVAIDFVLQARGLRPLGREKAESARSRRTQALFRAVAEAVDADLLVLAALDEGDNLQLQLYSPRSDVFSQGVAGTALYGGAPEERIVSELIDELLSQADPSGAILREATSTKTVPIFVGRNPALNDLLLGEEPPERVVVVSGGTGTGGTGGGKVRKPVHKQPVFWILIGSAVAGGVVGAIAGVNASQVEAEHIPGNGTVTVHINE